MDDLMSRINELLSDEESVRQLSELAQMMNSETTEDADNKHTEETNGDQPDLSSIIKLTGIINAASQQDKNADLLLALKPHLGAEKQKRVDKAIKLLKLLAIWNIAKDSGILQELI
ncbi:hypothetical protein SAMN02910265_01704 [Ruminococcus flavefaciens]|uniref:Uncharacterized protein n=1 Tax=Ruminococcus flavefaciens TaxID=1265 RepID=A0A1H6JF64_RUMFL|nr:hypothetical protein [Ruminococcus flavefaciens]SEH60926.1 hypothetical protein SAMN02910265_01704 [Ruminococcus flavefaciens]